MFLGMAGKLILPDLSSSNNVIAALVVELFPHGLKGLVLVAVLSAIMSTADISVLTGSASLTKDIYQRYINPNVSEKTLLHVGSSRPCSWACSAQFSAGSRRIS